MLLSQLIENVVCLFDSSIQMDFSLDATGHHTLGMYNLEKQYAFHWYKKDEDFIYCYKEFKVVQYNILL